MENVIQEKQIQEPLHAGDAHEHSSVDAHCAFRIQGIEARRESDLGNGNRREVPPSGETKTQGQDSGLMSVPPSEAPDS